VVLPRGAFVALFVEQTSEMADELESHLQLHIEDNPV
jgi:hypothetical protein